MTSELSRSMRLYPDDFKTGPYDAPADYQPIVELFGKPLIQVDDDQYSGDTRVLYRDGDRYGLLIFGWGSCSGCDALQGCRGHREVDKLIDELESSVRWWDSAEEAMAYFTEHDWGADFSWHEGETRDFVRRVLEHLGHPDPAGFVEGIKR